MISLYKIKVKVRIKGEVYSPNKKKKKVSLRIYKLNQLKVAHFRISFTTIFIAIYARCPNIAPRAPRMNK